MVGFPQDVEEVYFDEGNIMDQAEKGMYLIDMTTTSPMISKKIYEEGKKKGVHVVDAPVTGGDTGAKAGTLSILVGGNKLWERISIIREKLDVDSMPRW